MIGELLKAERQKLNLTQKQLAEKSGISFVSISRFENGTNPRLSIITKIFDAMGKTLQIEVKDKTIDVLDMVSN
jgi:transcriptional regulator with XRE-family HTH domain